MVNKFRAAAQRFKADEQGATAIEYGLIAAIIALGIIATLTIVGGELSAVFQGIADAFVTILS